MTASFRSTLPPVFEDFSIFDVSKNCPMTGICYHAIYMLSRYLSMIIIQ